MIGRFNIFFIYFVQSDHVKPFGEHRPAEDGLKTLKYSPSSSDFYHWFVYGRRPVVVKGAANHWPAISRWNNESYLRENYGSSPFYVEFRKKFKNEQPIRKPLKLQDFLNIYKNQEVYLDSLIPPTKMIHDIILPYFLGCSELASKINALNLLMNSGGTTSAFHQDGYENVITVISGTKTIILIDSKYSEKLYAEENFLFPGVLAFNPDAIDFTSFPKLMEVPYYKVTLYPGIVMTLCPHPPPCSMTLFASKNCDWMRKQISRTMIGLANVSNALTVPC